MLLLNDCFVRFVQNVKWRIYHRKWRKTVFQKRGIKVDTLYKGKGCSACKKTGYRGRMAIHEILMMDDTIQSLMMNHAPLSELKKYALRSGMIFLLDDGLIKAKNGLTTLEEVLRVALQD